MPLATRPVAWLGRLHGVAAGPWRAFRSIACRPPGSVHPRLQQPPRGRHDPGSGASTTSVRPSSRRTGRNTGSCSRGSPRRRGAVPGGPGGGRRRRSADPWTFIGHATPLTGAALVDHLVQTVDPRGFVYIPAAAPLHREGVSPPESGAVRAGPGADALPDLVLAPFVFLHGAGAVPLLAPDRGCAGQDRRGAAGRPGFGPAGLPDGRAGRGRRPAVGRRVRSSDAGPGGLAAVPDAQPGDCAGLREAGIEAEAHAFLRGLRSPNFTLKSTGRPRHRRFARLCLRRPWGTGGEASGGPRRADRATRDLPEIPAAMRQGPLFRIWFERSCGSCRFPAMIGLFPACGCSRGRPVVGARTEGGVIDDAGSGGRDDRDPELE